MTVEFEFTTRKGTSFGAKTEAEYVINCGIEKISVLDEETFHALAVHNPKTEYIIKKTDGSLVIYIGDVPVSSNSETDLVHGKGITNIAAMTQDEYDALESYDPGTLYVLT